MARRFPQAKLAALRRAFAPLQSGEFIRTCNKLCAAQALSLVQSGFRKGVDPYGAPWAPLKHPSPRRKGGRVLVDTGRLKNSFHAEGTERGFNITSDVAYAALHNYGGSVSHPARRQRNIHDYGGKLISKKEAKKAFASSIRVSFARIGAHSIQVPARPIIPTPGNIGVVWEEALERVERLALQRQFRGLL